MLETISRMFGSNGADTTEESDGPVGGDDPADETPTAHAATGHPGEGDPPVGSTPPDGDGGDDGATPDVEELDVRLDELDDELSSTDASIRELRSSQEEMAASVDGMNDTVRQLVGVYDRLAAEENPFIEGPDDPHDSSAPIPGADGGGESSAREGHWGDEQSGWGDGDTPSPEADGADDEVVDFDDLQVAAEELVETPRSEEPPAASASADDRERPTGDRRGAVLETVPDGYAGEALVMEWLATLMDRSGPAGAFRAVDYYENVGWISPAVGDRLVDVIGGPALDVFVDPTQPREPTAEEHAVSHEYLRVMARLNDI